MVPEWTARIRGSSEATVRIPSIRGEIRDRNGIALVQNRASYEVDFYLPEMVKGYRQRVGTPPMTEYRGVIGGMPKDLKEPDIVKIVNDGVVPRLDDLHLARDYNANQLQRHYRNNTEVPFAYIKDIDFKTMARFSEHDVGLPGVDIAIKPVRSYVYGALGAHMFGYVGAPDDTNQARKRRSTRFIRAMWRENPTSKKRWTNSCAVSPANGSCVATPRAQSMGSCAKNHRSRAPMFISHSMRRIQSIAEEALRVVSRAGAVVVDPEERQRFGDGIGAVIRPKHIHSQHQSERLESAAERRRRSAREPRDQRTASGLDF